MIKKLLARLAQIKAEANKILEIADSEADGVMTEEQTKQFDDLMAEAKNVQASIDHRQQLEQIKMEDEQGQGRQSAPQSTQAAVEVKDRKDPKDGFEDIAEFATSVQKACQKGASMVDDRLQVQAAPSNFHRETGSPDGYEVPAQFRAEIWKMLFEAEDDLFSMVVNEPTNSNSVEMLSDESTPWGATGIQAAWSAEGVQLNASRLETKSATMKLNKLHAYVLATEELLEDSPRLANRLTQGAADALRWKVNDSIIYGTGAGQMKGYFNSAALVSVAKEAGQSADTIVAANVLKMYSRMLAGSLNRAIWLGNSDIVPQLASMTIGNQPVWTGPSNLKDAPGGLLLGRPFIPSEHAKTLGDKGDIQFVDPKGYYAATKKQGIKMSTSIHLFFDYDIQAFKWTVRIGGQPFLSAPVSSANGSNTKSHFITLDERA